jgi:hypothetical protein
MKIYLSVEISKTALLILHFSEKKRALCPVLILCDPLKYKR